MDLSSQSTEYVRFKVEAVVNGSRKDVTVDPCYVALTSLDAEPLPTDWRQGDWETVAGTYGGPDLYFARLLVGPNGGRLVDPGRYRAWLKVSDAPEQPVRRCGVLRIFGRTPMRRDAKVRFRLQ